ncbi:MAG: hypothetical protein JW940_14355, partial [Polyangiaceae bacterium]|nr:hypothetical protein [Polyangiaceae bacterium]
MGGVGSPCDDANPCDVSPDACLAGPVTNPPGGICTGYCDNNSPCPEGAVCVQVKWSQAAGMCLAPCTSDSDCREGWSCQPHRIPTADAKDYVTTNACWAGGDAGSRLGDVCTRDVECISHLCLYESDVRAVCSVPCDDSKPCLAGFVCGPDTECTTEGCGYCVSAQHASP